jgi:flagellar FliJ protein
MTRAQRLQPVQKVIDAAERRRAETLAGSETRVKQSESKLTELEQYRADYQRAYHDRVAIGISSAGLRDYQLFLARLSEAIRQQTLLVSAARLERDQERQRWQDAARRAKAIDHVVENWQSEDRRDADRREQRDSDERAQRPKSKVTDSQTDPQAE